jgi:hypothetical protein
MSGELMQQLWDEGIIDDEIHALRIRRAGLSLSDLLAIQQIKLSQRILSRLNEFDTSREEMA